MGPSDAPGRRGSLDTANPGDPLPQAAPFTDTHAHVEKFAESLGEEGAMEVMDSYARASVGPAPALLLDPGTDVDDLPRRVALAARLLGLPPLADGRIALPDWLRLAAGLWPGRPALDEPEASVAALGDSIAAVSGLGVGISAIGECGLDFHHMEADEKTQLRLFSLQIELARGLGLPLIVHSRDAAKATLDALGRTPRDIPVIIHCFGYGPDEARAFLEAGAWISFAGNLTYKKSEGLRASLVMVPEDRLLLETDAPYMNPEPRRGKPSSPVDIGRTYEKAALLRGTAASTLAAKVGANAFGIFAKRE